MRQHLRLLSLLIATWFALANHVHASPVLKVVLTGDSITAGVTPPGGVNDGGGYGEEFATLVAGSTAVTSSEVIGAGSLQSEGYMGVLTGATTNYGQLSTDAVAGLTPSKIVFMLGTNDSFQVSSLAYRQTLFNNHITSERSLPHPESAFDLFEASDATEVIVLSILPVSEAVSGTRVSGEDGTKWTDRIAEYNLMLQTEANARAKFRYVDVNTAIKKEPNWETQLLASDGYHLTTLGQEWLANVVFTEVTAVPEPSAFACLSVALFLGTLRRYHLGC